MSARLSVLTREHALREWPVLSGFLEKSIPYAMGRIETKHWRDRVEQGEALVGMAWEPEARHIFAVFYCEIETHPTGKKVFTIAGAGGSDVTQWAHLWPVAVELAREFGCDQVEVYGRRGWKKFIDAQEAATVYVKDLTQ